MRTTSLTLLPLLAAAGAVLFVRLALGFTYPVPWPDEVGFVAPAFDFAHTGSFFDPGMNPDRVVMWMPPGYMLLLAAVFRVAGYSFALARWVSTLCCLASLGVAAVLVWRLTAGWRRVAAGWAVGVAFLSPCMLASSNLARMDMLLALLILLALLAASAGRLYLAAALVAAAGTVHFNAVYFAPPVALALAAAWWGGTLGWPRAWDWAALAAATLAVLAYALYAALHWAGFRADIGFQLSMKALAGHNDALRPLWPVLAGLALAAVALARARLRPAGICALFGLAFLVMAHNGHELWYDYGQALGAALIALGLLAAPAPQATARPALRRATQAATAAAAALVLVLAARTASIEPLFTSPAIFTHRLLAKSDIAKVRRFIATLQPGDMVNFGWNGTELFFLPDLARAGAHWTIIRHSVTEVWPLRPYDWRVRCDSSLWPRYMFAYDIDYLRQGKDTGCDIFRGPGSHKS